MPTRNDSPGARLIRLWMRLEPFPGGRWLFSRVVGWMAPYTGALGARVEDLGPGYCRVRLKERWGVRNHLRSVHAVALANLGEVTSGLAMLTGLPPTIRGIVTSLSVTYSKKARGTLTAECRAEAPAVSSETEHEVQAVITDTAGEEVARVAVRWNLRPGGAEA